MHNSALVSRSMDVIAVVFDINGCNITGHVAVGLAAIANAVFAMICRPFLCWLFSVYDYIIKGLCLIVNKNNCVLCVLNVKNT